MKIETSIEKRSDWSEWKRYKTASGVEVVVTSAFREIMKNGEKNIVGHDEGISQLFLRLLHKYRKSYEANSYDEIRNFIASGQEASFYGAGVSNIGIREEHHVWSHEDKLDRMDTIQHLLDLGSIPRWIKSPIHYGMLKVPQMIRWYYDKFIVIEKIDHGVTAVDIIDEPRSEEIKKAILREFSSYGFTSMDDEKYKEFQKEIYTKYREVKEKLEEAFMSHKSEFPGWTFESLFADLYQRNLVVTYNETPIGWSRVSFWIIDQ